MRSQVCAHCCLVMCVAASHNRMHSAPFSFARDLAVAGAGVATGDFGLAGAAAFGATGGDTAGGAAPACASTAPAPRTSDRNVMPTMRMDVLALPCNLEQA